MQESALERDPARQNQISRHCEHSEAIQDWIASSAAPPRNDATVIRFVRVESHSRDFEEIEEMNGDGGSVGSASRGISTHLHISIFFFCQ
jgi:hypothetical protein